MNLIFKMREKSTKSTKPIHEPNFRKWAKKGKMNITPVFRRASLTKKEKYDFRIGHTSFLFGRLEKPISFFWATTAAIGAGNETTFKLFYTHSNCLLIFSTTVFALPVNHFFACRQYFVRRKSNYSNRNLEQRARKEIVKTLKIERGNIGINRIKIILYFQPFGYMLISHFTKNFFSHPSFASYCVF